jgi:hypothetical protein
LQRGHVADSIVQQAAEMGCDLIVIGSHGRRGLRRALGSETSDRGVDVAIELARTTEVACDWCTSSTSSRWLALLILP